MSFFRRLFNNSPGDEASQDVESGTEGENAPEDVSTGQGAKYPPGTGELPATEELVPDESIDAAIEALDQTLPVSDELDEITLPDRGLETGTQEVPATAILPGIGVTRPLPDAEQFTATTKGHIAFGQLSDQGMVRLNNQDSAFSFFFTSVSVEEFPDFGVFIVADGMGGHQEGEKASAITARTVADDIMHRIYTPLIKGKDMNSADQPTIVEVLVEAVQKANEAVRQQVEDGGTTLTGVVIRGDAAHIAHVGDSRAYWISDAGTIEKITRDHSVVERLIELGQITREEAEFHEQRNVLYRAIGQNEEVEVEIHRKRLVSDSALLICSDGLWNMVGDGEMLEIIKNNPDPQDACEKLVALANAHGGSDNITAILIKTPTN